MCMVKKCSDSWRVKAGFLAFLNISEMQLILISKDFTDIFLWIHLHEQYPCTIRKRAMNSCYLRQHLHPSVHPHWTGTLYSKVIYEWMLDKRTELRVKQHWRCAICAEACPQWCPKPKHSISRYIEEMHCSCHSQFHAGLGDPYYYFDQMKDHKQHSHCKHSIKRYRNWELKIETQPYVAQQ